MVTRFSRCNDSSNVCSSSRDTSSSSSTRRVSTSTCFMAHHAQEFLLASLRRFPLGDIQDHYQHEFSLLIDHGSRNQDGCATAILVEMFLLIGVHGSGRKNGPDGLCRRLLIFREIQLLPGDRPGEEFFLAVADHLHEALIGFIEAPIDIDHDHPEDVGAYQREQFAFAVLELLLDVTLSGHIAEDDHTPDDLACGIANWCAADIEDEVFPLASAAHAVHSVCA